MPPATPHSAHVDGFARDRLPPPHELPEFLFDRPELQFPDHLNCATELLDRWVDSGQGGRLCVQGHGLRWTYADLRAQANRIARVLVEDLGLVPGNRVLLRGANSPMLAACWFAVVKAGGIAVGSMPLLRARELVAIVDKAQVSHALCDARLADELPAALDEHCAVLMLTHVNYRSGRMHDMAALSRAAADAGALTVWDLAHSAGAVPVDLHTDGADFAIGCGYKYLNGGPGAPAFVWAHPRHAERFWQPLAGWMGHVAPFEFSPGYRPAPGIARYLCGTPAVLSLAALECGVDTVLAAEPLGGMAALRRKSLALTRLFADQVQASCPSLTLVSPRDDAQRGSQVCLSHPQVAYPVVQALIGRSVIGDFRAGDTSHPAGAVDILRFGFTPLYLRFVDAWDAAEQLRQVLESGEWQRPEFNQRQAVT